MAPFKSFALAGLLIITGQAAVASYMSLFNIEGESNISAQYVTYDSLTDMLLDTNRTGVHTPESFGFGHNIIGSGSDGDDFWSLFNIEGESSVSAQYVTYDSLNDMLLDTNRTGVFTPDSFGFGHNIIGSGSDGDDFWSLFNIEGESSVSAQYVTYDSLNDMLLDTNRTGVFTPDSFGFGHNIVGSGSDGDNFWSLFNIEGESSVSAQYVTYDNLTDMLLDTNRTGVFTPDSFGFGHNIVGSSAMILPSIPVPEPSALVLLMVGLAGLWLARRRQ